jgi:hypothetical protein
MYSVGQTTSLSLIGYTMSKLSETLPEIFGLADWDDAFCVNHRSSYDDQIVVMIIKKDGTCLDFCREAIHMVKHAMKPVPINFVDRRQIEVK